MTGESDPVLMIAQQHRMLEVLLAHLEAAGDSSETVIAELTESLIKFLVRQFVAEEAHLHPAMLMQLDDGGLLVERNLTEHDDAETIMERLLLLKPADAAFWPMVGRLGDVVRRHFLDDHPHPFDRVRCRAEAKEDLHRLHADIAAALDRLPELGLPVSVPKPTLPGNGVLPERLARLT